TAFEGNSGPDILTSSSALRDPERSYGGWPPGMLQRVHPLPAADERAHVTGQDRRLVKIHFARQRCHQQRDLRHLLGGHDVVVRLRMLMLRPPCGICAFMMRMESRLQRNGAVMLMSSAARQ